MNTQVYYDYEQRERLRDSSGMCDSGRTKDRKGTIRRQLTSTSYGDQRKNNIPKMENFLKVQPHDRTPEEIHILSRILKEEHIFTEFHHDIKILRMLSGVLRVKRLSSGQGLFEQKGRDENLYRLIKGEATIKRAVDSSVKSKSKGEYVETFEEFKFVKDIEVTCKQDCILIYLSHTEYEEAVKLYQEHKRIKQMMLRTSFFSKLKRKQMAYIFQGCQQLTIGSKQFIFRQGQENNDLFYFVVNGQVSIQKRDPSRRTQFVCYISIGSLFGEEVLFEQEKRTYSVAVHSSQANLLVISGTLLQEMISQHQVHRDSIVTESYREYLQMKENHYSSKVEENICVKGSFHSSRNHKMSPVKQKQINSLLRGIENNTDKLYQKEKLVEKRFDVSKQMLKVGAQISVETPLFGRQNFPGLRRYMKKNKTESKHKENCRLPAIH